MLGNRGISEEDDSGCPTIQSVTHFIILAGDLGRIAVTVSGCRSTVMPSSSMIPDIVQSSHIYVIACAGMTRNRTICLWWARGRPFGAIIQDVHGPQAGHGPLPGPS